MDETTLSFAAIVFAVIVTRAAIRQFRIAARQLTQPQTSPARARGGAQKIQRWNKT